MERLLHAAHVAVAGRGVHALSSMVETSNKVVARRTGRWALPADVDVDVLELGVGA
jgi:hypothetical protein